MPHDLTLEERVENMVVSYNMLPWWMYPENWKANFPGRRWPGYEQLQDPTRFLAVTKYNGKKAGRIAKIKESERDRANVYYRVGYDITGKTLDPVIEWAEDVSREEQLNSGGLGLDRLTAMMMSVHNGTRTISMYQHQKSIFDSWYALPFKLPFYVAMLPVSIISKAARRFIGRELIELGKLYAIENTGQEGDITLDQNLMRQYLTLGLGRYYEVRDQEDNVYLTVKRQPLVKLLTFGLKNRYKVHFRKPDEKLNKLAYGIVDYVQNETIFRLFRPKKSIPAENIFRFGT